MDGNSHSVHINFMGAQLILSIIDSIDFAYFDLFVDPQSALKVLHGQSGKKIELMPCSS